MTLKTDLSLNEQRQLLRLKLQAQRLVIASQLEQKAAEKAIAKDNSPRSIIMRFLTQQHGGKILAEVAAVMLGTRFLKSTYVQLFAKIAKPLVLSKLNA